MVGSMSVARRVTPVTRVTRVALTVALAVSALTGCKTPPPFPMSRSAGANCGDPCGAMQCPSGYDCTWDEQCHPRCDMRMPQTPQFSR
jgi:hypothetical protein